MCGRERGYVLLLAFLTESGPCAGLGPDIQTLEIHGTRRAVALETHAGEPLELARVERDVRRLWATGWFDDVKVETADAPQGIQVRFTVVERPRLYLRRVVFEPPHERRAVPFVTGIPVDVVFAARAAAELRQQLKEEGYADALVEAELVPAGFPQADLRLRINPGPQYRVEEVRFSGTLGLSVHELRGVLRATRWRRLLPGLGRRWQGWRLLAPFSHSRLGADVERLRSLYLSRGYPDARVEVGDIRTRHRNVTITLRVDSGPRYQVRQVRVEGPQRIQQLAPPADGALPARELCACLLDERRQSEQRGELAFSAHIELADAATRAYGPPPKGTLAAAGSESHNSGLPVALTAKVHTGPAFSIRRIEFRGHRAVNDLTLRKALFVREGDLLDQVRLRQSVARLSRFASVEPVALSDVRVNAREEQRLADVTFTVKEKPRGRWALSGPFPPLSLLDPLQFAVSSRLPARGGGILELSTYFGTFSLAAWRGPILSFFPGSKSFWQPVVALERPHVPGQRWQSGFLLSPQLGWQATAASYGLAQLREAVSQVLGTNTFPAPDLSVPTMWRAGTTDPAGQSPFAGMLRCEERKPSWRRLRAAGVVAANWLLTPLR
jgi:outer membrane protein insertion porin family